MSLDNILLKINKYEIPIYVSDNASTDKTCEIVADYKKIYPYIFYSKNEKNFGADYNITTVLKMSETEYAWLMSDDDHITEYGIEKVLNVIELNRHDLIVVNGGNLTVDADEVLSEHIYARVDDIPSGLYIDKDPLLVDLGWHMPWMSCLIFSSKIIKDGSFDKYQGTSLVQFATIFDYLAYQKFSVYWEACPLVYSINDERHPAWIKRLFEIWAQNWYEVVIALPSDYSQEAKLKCVLNHGLKSGLFNGWNAFYQYRKTGHFDYKLFMQYRKYLPYVTNVPLTALLVISILPKKVIGLARNLNMIRRKQTLNV
jgi:glycosyltransferase involved in cell wall biosynthesis